jgi:DNA polymerase III sliding clamp (beta) subunit (PCNA family)
MDILPALRFVRGAVAKKDIIPALSHFKIKDGRVTGYNGKMALSSPIDINLECYPKAAPFVTAINACDGTVQLHLTPTGRLAVRAGKFRSLVECTEEDYPDIHPAGVEIPLTQDTPLLPALRKLYPITSDDASRPWAAAILFDGNTATASNNIVIAQYWLGFHFPYRVCVPRYAVDELLRINEEPINLFVHANSVTFNYANGRWLRTQLNEDKWPDFATLLDRMPAGAPPLPEQFFETIEWIKPFTDKLERVYFRPGNVSTFPDESEGTLIEYEGSPGVGIYSAEMLLLLKGLATSLDLSTYPKPGAFYGESVRGALIGLRS